MIRIIFAVEEKDERDLRFVEVENGDGESISLGRWEDDSRGYKVLVIDDVFEQICNDFKIGFDRHENGAKIAILNRLRETI